MQLSLLSLQICFCKSKNINEQGQISYFRGNSSAMTTIKIKRLGIADAIVAQKLFLTLQEVFGIKEPTTAEEAYVLQLLSNPAFICMAAINNDKVVGGLTAYELPMYHASYSECYIYDIGIKTTFQRMGIGRQLIAALKEHCNVNNIKTIFVEAQEEDAHAIEFYRSTGANEEQVHHFNYECK